VKRDASPKKSSRAKRKTVTRQATFKSSPWYEKAALSISAAQSRE
jgi:hypothetical protein